jgi:glutamate 5-kinase
MTYWREKLPRKELLSNVRRVVIKVGTSIITEGGKISSSKISRLVSDIVSIMERGNEVVLVSSGAISAGSALLDKKRDYSTIPEKQALASVGQIALMNEYRRFFIRSGYEIGQILLTEDDVKHRRRYLNARHTFNSLLKFGVIPIVNENDSVVIKEIKFGDNDTLSAHVANIIEADLLILLSDIDGFYWNLTDAEPVDEICEITEDVLMRAGGTESEWGTGGMATKIRAAEIIIRSGEMMVIANGQEEGILRKIMNGEKTGTLFLGKGKSLSSRKRWIAFSKKTKGAVRVDDGAVNAICNKKKSLLASGITEVAGVFELGDAVEIQDEKGNPIGKGIVNYTNNELQVIKGKKTKEIKNTLGSHYFDEVINRDDMIIY